MVREDCWRQVHRLFHVERRSKAKVARQVGLDRKTVRGILQGAAWRPYARAGRADTLLTEHTTCLQGRAPQVQYSARILFQELRQRRGYPDSYETVKRFVRPLRDVEQAAERATVRFETPPGQQSQIDWGQGRIDYRGRWATPGGASTSPAWARPAASFSTPTSGRSSISGATPARISMIGRARVCQPGGDGRVVWNATFKQFADYWSFEPHRCRAYRAQTKGKVESGVKYISSATSSRGGRSSTSRTCGSNSGSGRPRSPTCASTVLPTRTRDSGWGRGRLGECGHCSGRDEHVRERRLEGARQGHRPHEGRIISDSGQGF